MVLKLIQSNVMMETLTIMMAVIHFAKSKLLATKVVCVMVGQNLL